MAKELYLYSGIYSYTAEYLLSQLEENKDSDVLIRMSTNGGDPQAAWGIIAKMQERTKKTIISVDGKAYSTGFYMLAYASRVRALTVSDFLVHRAAYSDYYEKTASAAELTGLENLNKDLRKALEKKVDQRRFETITGVTFDQIFDMASRIDVPLTAQQAFEVGLVDELIDINQSEINALHKFIGFDDHKAAAHAANPLPNPNSNQVMNLEELKTKHPEVYAAAVKAGVDQERDRVGSFMAFVDLDPEAVTKGIKEGSTLTATQMAEFTRKALSAETLKKVEADSPGTVTTEADKTKVAPEAKKELTEFEAALKNNFKRSN